MSVLLPQVQGLLRSRLAQAEGRRSFPTWSLSLLFSTSGVCTTLSEV